MCDKKHMGRKSNIVPYSDAFRIQGNNTIFYTTILSKRGKYIVLTKVFRSFNRFEDAVHSQCLPQAFSFHTVSFSSLPINSSIVALEAELIPSCFNTVFTVSKIIFQSPKNVMWSTYFTSQSKLFFPADCISTMHLC